MSEDKNQELWEQANDPQELVFQYWGELHLRPWECALVKGIGKVPFDPTQHKRSSLAMEMQIIPIAETNVAFEIKREPVDFSKEYTMFLKSVWDAGIDYVQRANGQWVRASYQNTGEKYTNKDGEKKNKTYLHIEQFFPNEEACREDYFETTGKDPDAEEVPFINPEPEQTAINATAGDDKPVDLESLKEFLKMAIKDAITMNDDKPILYNQLLPWFDTPKYLALKEVYGNPEAKKFVDKVIAEVLPF